jgi:hypothetical protein
VAVKTNFYELTLLFSGGVVGGFTCSLMTLAVFFQAFQYSVGFHASYIYWNMPSTAGGGGGGNNSRFNFVAGSTKKGNEKKKLNGKK